MGGNGEPWSLMSWNATARKRKNSRNKLPSLSVDIYCRRPRIVTCKIYKLTLFLIRHMITPGDGLYSPQPRSKENVYKHADFTIYFLPPLTRIDCRWLGNSRVQSDLGVLLDGRACLSGFQALEYSRRFEKLLFCIHFCLHFYGWSFSDGSRNQEIPKALIKIIRRFFPSLLNCEI